MAERTIIKVPGQGTAAQAGLAKDITTPVMPMSGYRLKPPGMEWIQPLSEKIKERKGLLEAELETKQKFEEEKPAEQSKTIQAVYNNLQGLKSKLNEIPYSGEWSEGVPDVMRIKGKAYGWAAENIPNFNPNLRTYQRVKEGFTGLMARTFGGEKGVMTDRDIARFVRFIPDYETTEEERKDQWGVVDMMYNNIADAMNIKAKNPDSDIKVEINDKGQVRTKLNDQTIKTAQAKNIINSTKTVKPVKTTAQKRKVDF